MTLLLAAVLLSIAQGGQEARLPAPDPAAQKQAEKSVREIFAEDYSRKSPAERKLLAKKLLSVAAETKDDPPVRYVLRHQDGRAEGEGSYRLVDGARRCEVKFPVRLEACEGTHATLSSQPVTAVSDRCAAAYSDIWIDVPLVRE